MLNELNILRYIYRLNPAFFKRFIKNRLGVGLRRYLRFGLDSIAPKPELITFELTKRCNLNCRMCWQNRKENNFSKELGIEELKRIIDEISVFKPVIQVTGGEPFMYPDFLEFIRYVKQKGLICLINTNGTLINNKNVDFLLDTGIDKISISLDGSKDVHNLIRQNKDAFDATINGIRTLIQLKIKRKVQRPIIQITSVICSHNYLHLEDIVRIFLSFKDGYLTFQHLYFNTKNTIEKHNELFGGNLPAISFTDNIDINKIDTLSMAKEIDCLKKKYRNLLILFWPNLKHHQLGKYYKHPEELVRKSFCIMPWFFARISADGDVKICPDNIDYVFGNLKEEFKKIWNNKKAIYFRDLIKKHKTFPVCSRCCGLYKS
jgi:radical SAM protein with 4Fe4S-binding SPASM domain